MAVISTCTNPDTSFIESANTTQKRYHQHHQLHTISVVCHVISPSLFCGCILYQLYHSIKFDSLVCLVYQWQFQFQFIPHSIFLFVVTMNYTCAYFRYIDTKKPLKHCACYKYILRKNDRICYRIHMIPKMDSLYDFCSSCAIICIAIYTKIIVNWFWNSTGIHVYSSMKRIVPAYQILMFMTTQYPRSNNQIECDCFEIVFIYIVILRYIQWLITVSIPYTHTNQ